ncbi:MAG: hypothetical protein WAR57_01875 [Candidatus Phosphoribacter sp.]|nr:hypothetical protein [Actinomycetales bacterium]
MVTTHMSGNVEVRCDRCLAAPITPLGIRTWSSRDGALLELLGPELSWTLVDGRLQCARCAREARCAESGHRYRAWSPVPGSQLAVRVCSACHHEDRAPGYVLSHPHTSVG